MPNDENDMACAPPEENGRTPRPSRWTATMKAEFLDHLAASCSINAASWRVGMNPRSVFRLRRRDPRFAAQWAKAIESGYEVLELRLIGHALGGGGPLVEGTDEIAEPIDVTLALSLLTQHRARRDGTRREGLQPLKRVTAEQTDASILRKLKAMGRLPVPSR